MIILYFQTHSWLPTSVTSAHMRYWMVLYRLPCFCLSLVTSSSTRFVFSSNADFFLFFFLRLAFLVLQGIIAITISFTAEILWTFAFRSTYGNTMAPQRHQIITADETPHILNISCRPYPDFIPSLCVANRKIKIIWHQFRTKLLQNFFPQLGWSWNCTTYVSKHESLTFALLVGVNNLNIQVYWLTSWRGWNDWRGRDSRSLLLG